MNIFRGCKWLVIIYLAGFWGLTSPALVTASVDPLYTWVGIGNPNPPGQTLVESNKVTITTGGLDIGGLSDQGHFFYRECNGDFDAQVRVESLAPSDLWAKAGLMARASLETGSPCAAALATPTLAGCFFSSRSSSGANMTSKGSFPVNYPATWLRLQRVGDVFSGFASFDGRTWRLLSSTTLTVTNPVYLGLMASSHATNLTTTVAFANFTEVTAPSNSAPMVEAEPLGPSSRKTGLVISEIMYHPAARADGKNLEFVELFNANPFFEDITGHRLSGDIDYTFPPGTVLPGGGFLVVAKSPADLRAVYGLAQVLGPYTNNLTANGLVRLRNTRGAVLLEIPYSHEPPWPVAADGAGHSLVLSRPSYGEASPRAWSASFRKGGSPGAIDGARADALSRVVINEFLARAAAPVDNFIELYNHNPEPVDISGCYLSDDPATNKFKIPAGTSIPAAGFACFTAAQLGFSPPAGGGALYFTSPEQTQVIDAIRFEGQGLGMSMGRQPDGAEVIRALSNPTPGAANSAAWMGAVVINEIMYKPISGEDDDEYIELYNAGTQSVEVSGWRFTAGIDFNLPAPSVLPAGGFLVIAKNAARLRTNYPNLNLVNTVGDYRGKLSNRGERLALARPENIRDPITGQTSVAYIVVDEVTYGTGGRWGRWSDGGGSSLELVDARADRRHASNWADSDETKKSDWFTVERTGLLDSGVGSIDALHVLLLDAGECLVDNVEARIAGATNNLISNSTFENGLNNCQPQGDHVRSSQETAEGFQSAKSLHVRATNQGDTGANRIRCTLSSPSALTAGRTATVRAQARWLRGSPELLLRLKGNYLEAYGRLPVPKNLGTPGAPNSRAVSNAGPAIYAVTHTPPLPAAGQPVVVTARFHDPDGLGELALRYRIDPATTYTNVLFNDLGVDGDAIAGDGIYSAAIPGQPSGKLAAFYLEAADKAQTPATARFPHDAPARECLARFGEVIPASAFGVYRMWFSTAVLTAWNNRPMLSNEELDGTFVYGNQRVIYNMSARYTGSPFHQSFTSPVTSDCHYAMSMPADDPLLGTTSFNKLHAPGNGPYDDDTIQREQAAYWMVRQLDLPANYQRYVHVYVNGTKKRYLMEDTQVPGKDGLEEQFPDDNDGNLYKLSGWFEYGYAASGALPMENYIWCSLNKYLTASGARRTEFYRWNWAVRAAGGTASDFAPVFDLVDAANTPESGSYVAGLEALVDMEGWMRTFAIEHAVGNWDSFGNRNSQNMFAYKPRHDKWKLIIWDYNIVLGNGSYTDGPTGDNLLQYYTGDRGMGRIYSTPKFVRAYWRAMQDIASGPMAAGKIDPVLDAKHAAFKANGVTVAAPTAIKTWITSRRSYLLSQLNRQRAPFAITNPGIDGLATNQNLVVLTGTASFEVASIQINGREYPVTWDTATNWSARIALSAGANEVRVQGFDQRGQPLAAAFANPHIVFDGVLERVQDHVVINEIMYHPAATNAEYIELFNTSRLTAFDLSDFRLNGLDFTFDPGALIPPQACLVVVKDRTAFAAAYGNKIPIAGVFNGRLDPDGETIQLIQPGATPASERLVDEVTYSNALPWPAAADGAGASLQLADPAVDNNRVSHWAALDPALLAQPEWRFVSLTGVAANARVLVYHSPYQLPPDTNDISGLWEGVTSIPNSPLDMQVSLVRGANNRWTGTMSIQGGTLALSNLKFTNGAVYFELSGITGLPRWQGKLSANAKSITGTFYQEVQGSTFSCPFEIHRADGADDIQGGDVYIDDLTLVAGETPGAGPNLIHNGDFETPLTASWQIANNHKASALSTSVKHSGGSSLHLVASLGGKDETSALWQDTEPLTPGGVYTLSYWYLPSTNGNELTIRLADNSLASTHSIAPLKAATPGAPNSASPAGTPAPPLFINELQPQNLAGATDHQGDRDPWVELVNYGANAIRLDGYYLGRACTNLTEWAFPSNAVIQPGQYLIVWLDGEPDESSAGELHTAFRLAPGPGSLVLSRWDASQAAIVDYLNYPALLPGSSFGAASASNPAKRVRFEWPTPGESNDRVPQAVPVYFTEWMASNTRTLADPSDNDFEDWFELYNNGTNAVDLTGYRLTDDATNTTKYVIPAGVIIPAGGYLLVWADGEDGQKSSGSLHVNFKLSQSGESLGLYSPGGALVDAVTFGPQTADVSQGRNERNLAGPFIFMAESTPGATNQASLVPGKELKIKRWGVNIYGRLQLAWAGETGAVYRVEFREGVADAAWQPLSGEISVTNGETAFTDPSVDLPAHRFYRIVRVK